MTGRLVAISSNITIETLAEFHRMCRQKLKVFPKAVKTVLGLAVASLRNDITDALFLKLKYIYTSCKRLYTPCDG